MAPLPGTGRVSVAVPAAGPGFGCWAGAPSAAFDADGEVVLAYRLRDAQRRGGEAVVGGITLGKEPFGAESLERPALAQAEPVTVFAGDAETCAATAAAGRRGSAATRWTSRARRTA